MINIKVYTDNQHRICDIMNTNIPDLTEIDVPDWTFGDITDSQIKCYTCTLDPEGNPSIRLLVPPELFDQIGIMDQQRAADQEETSSLMESVVDNDYRLTALELGL